MCLWLGVVSTSFHFFAFSLWNVVDQLFARFRRLNTRCLNTRCLTTRCLITKKFENKMIDYKMWNIISFNFKKLFLSSPKERSQILNSIVLLGAFQWQGKIKKRYIVFNQNFNRDSWILWSQYLRTGETCIVHNHKASGANCVLLTTTTEIVMCWNFP